MPNIGFKAQRYARIFGFAMQSKAMLCQERISKAMLDEAYQSFANKGKPYYDNDETLFGVHAQVSFFIIFMIFPLKFMKKTYFGIWGLFVSS